MRDAVGGVVNIVLISLFMVVIAGYMAFNVSYVKAFKVKNKIIDLVEQYEGKCYPTQNPQCTKLILDYMDKIGYNTPVVNQGEFCKEDKYDCCNKENGYCIAIVNATSSGSGSTGDPKAYFKVLTQVNIDIPIINNVMPHMKVFQVTGDTKVLKVDKSLVK